MWYFAIYLGIFVVALIIEAVTMEIGAVWFALGSLFGIILSVIPNVPWWVPMVVSVVVSFVSLLSLRPLVKKLLARKIVRSNVDEMVAQRYVMKRGYTTEERGEVEINGLTWSVIGQTDEPIEKGALVEVLSISGNKLIVKKVGSEPEKEK